MKALDTLAGLANAIAIEKQCARMGAPRTAATIRTTLKKVAADTELVELPPAGRRGQPYVLLKRESQRE